MRILVALPIVFAGLVGAGAWAQDEPAFETPPIVEPLSQRFTVVVLDQPDRDLLKSSPRVNMMFDTRTGRSWILEYSRKPNSNAQGYVWVEVPFAAPPGAPKLP